MKTRMRAGVVGVLWLAGMLAADDPAGSPRALAPEVLARIEARLAADAKDLGVSVADLKRLRDLGYSQAELETQFKEHKRTARQLITEHEVLDELAKVVAEVNQRVHNLPATKQSEERERSLRLALVKIRWERKTSRTELRDILTRTSFLSEEELKRVVK